MNFLKEINYFYYRMAMDELRFMNSSDCYHGLTYNSILYVNVISQLDHCTVSKLAETLHITKSAVTIKVNELVRQGVLTKTRSLEDKRVFYLKLSPHVEEIFHMYDQIFTKIEETLKEQYTENELELFARMLHSISDFDWRNQT